MNPELKTFEDHGEPIPFSPDFAKRVLVEARRRRIGSRRRRAFSAGAALLLALVVVGRGPMHLGQARTGPDPAVLLAMGDLTVPGLEVAAEEDADADPGSYFVPDTEGQADDGEDSEDDSDVALFGQE